MTLSEFFSLLYLREITCVMTQNSAVVHLVLLIYSMVSAALLVTVYSSK